MQIFIYFLHHHGSGMIGLLLYGQNDIMFMLEYSLSLEWLDYYLYIVHWYHYGWSGFLPLNFTPHLEMEGWQWPSRWQLWKTGFKMKPGWMTNKILIGFLYTVMSNKQLISAFISKKKKKNYIYTVKSRVLTRVTN